MSTALTLVPQGLALPAHLQTPAAAAEIAAVNAAAGGGIKAGGSFPKISIKANKFHEEDPAIDQGAARTYMVNAQPGQPPLPMMCLEAVVIAANPALTKTYYAGEYVEGSAEAPTCQSSNGVTPDAHVANKQNAVCATCPQNQWGSKVSKLSGKDIKACDDSKQVVILPGSDLTYKALGLEIKKGSLKNWGLYVKALSDRNYSIMAVVTNITFDHTATGVLQFAFNRFLTAEEYAQVQARATGEDVKAIVAPSRTIALPAPAVQPALPPAASTAPAPAAPPAPAYVPPPAPPAPPAPVVGFGGAPAQASAQAPAQPPVAAEAPKRTRAPRKPVDPVPPLPGGEDYSYLPPAIKAALDTVGAGTPAGQALIAQFPRPTATQSPPAPVAAPQPAPAPVQPAGGFGVTVAPAAPQQPEAGAVAAGASLKDLLIKKLNGGA